MRYYVVKKKSSHASELMDPWSLTDSRVHIWYRLKKESHYLNPINVRRARYYFEAVNY